VSVCNLGILRVVLRPTWDRNKVLWCRRICRGNYTNLPAVWHTSYSTRSRPWFHWRRTYTSLSAYSCTGTCSR